MLKLKNMTFEDIETGEEIVAALPEKFQVLIPGNTEAVAKDAANCIIAEGYDWIRDVLLKK